MPQNTPSATYNTTQKYFLITDFATTLFWLFVFCRLVILYPLTGPKFLPGGIADFYINILTGTVFLELFNYATIFRLIPGTQTTQNSLAKPHFNTLMAVSFSRLVLAFVLFNYPKVTRCKAFALLLLFQSIKEFFRWFYNLQKVRLFNTVPWFNRVLRSITFTIASPIETASSFYLIFQSLIYSPYQSELLVYDARIKLCLKVLLVIYLPSFYLIYKRTLAKYFLSIQSHASYPSKKSE